ncbi:hypothetical protein NIES592_21815 [Fischerella major NIES-592]|uniref:Uncharacterized protein n=1 Tax=Fischerella major NIES-592 TaxID=210994 RepID=A0A1U7GTY8_9CYAN|nr:hypothetical protein [Fischerella major]OKH11346.1 hypothetical protein NIES592_21815 [Fischerella major NIES-592]
MKENHFSRVTALVMGLLMIFSGQALSFSLNPTKVNEDYALDHSNFIIAQEKVSVGVAVAVAVKVLNQAVSVVQTVAQTVPVNIPSKYRDIVLPKLRQAQQSMAKAQVSAQKGDNVQVVTSVSQAVAFMAEAQAGAKGDAGSVQVITQAIAKANEAIAIAQAQTQS